MTTRAQDIQRIALAQLVNDLRNVPDDCWKFFEALFTIPSTVNTVRLLTKHLRVHPSTLMSRFFRANLPSPKKYLAITRLIRAAEMFENPGLSIANVSDHLDYSSPQSFGRHVRGTLGISATELRARYDGEGMLQRFREEYVLAFMSVLRSFRPLTAPVGWYVSGSTSRQRKEKRVNRRAAGRKVAAKRARRAAR
jgi:AraC-like DNA-binding protein